MDARQRGVSDRNSIEGTRNEEKFARVSTRGGSVNVAIEIRYLSLIVFVDAGGAVSPLQGY